MATSNVQIGDLSVSVDNDTGGMLSDSQINALSKIIENLKGLQKDYTGLDHVPADVSIKYSSGTGSSYMQPSSFDMSGHPQKIEIVINVGSVLTTRNADGSPREILQDVGNELGNALTRMKEGLGNFGVGSDPAAKDPYTEQHSNVMENDWINEPFGYPKRTIPQGDPTSGPVHNGGVTAGHSSTPIADTLPTAEEMQRAIPSAITGNLNPHAGAPGIDNSNGPVFGPEQDTVEEMDYESWLNELANQISEEFFPIPDELTPLEEALEAAINRSSPLIIDLDDSGTIDLSAYSDTNTSFFDFDGDGYAERSGWVSASDGILVYDQDLNGKIEGSSEWFGTTDTDGFAILSEHDTNTDGQIDNEDSIWASLQIWQDFDQDGVADGGELRWLSAFNIISINLESVEVSQTNEGHLITHTGTIVVDDGISGPDTRIMHDVWFNYNDMASRYAQDYIFDIRAAYLPSQRGYGVLSDLHIAISNDNTGGGNLLDLVTDFSEISLSNMFAASNSITDDVREIMFRWAGVDGLSGNERGAFVDSRELGFLEAMTGKPFLQRGIYSNPQGVEAGEDINGAFVIALNHVYARLVAQSSGDALFEGDFFYNISTDLFEGITGINLTTLDSLETEATGLANTGEREIFWSNVLRVIEFTVGVDNLSGGDQTALDAAIEASDSALDMTDLIDGLSYARVIGVTESGTSGNDTINGSSADDDLSGGSAGNDTINGLAGNDVIQGQANDDVLTGGTGGDYVRGGLGNDDYIYAAGDGHDTYKEQGAGSGNDDDRIIFGSGIDIGDLTFSRAGNTDLVIDIDNGTYTGRIVIEDHFNYASGGGHIELLEFSDTSTYDLDGQAWTTYGTNGADVIRGVWNGLGGLGNDTIYGLDGNDEIRVDAPNETDSLANTVYGGNGNDRIYGDTGTDTLYGDDGDDYIDGGAGADTLSGGAGDDDLIGDTGNDTFIYSGGHDYIHDSSGTDAINLNASWNGVTPQYLRTGNDLTIWFDVNNTITIDGHFGTRPVESMVYANTTSVNLTTVSAVSQGTSGNDTLTGTSGVDTIYGHAGNDTLSGSGGNDLLYGGTGNDTLSGGAGNDYLDGGAGDDTMEGGGNDDTYFYASGDDYINDDSGTDTLIFANGWEIEEMTFDRYMADDNDLIIGINGTNSVTIEGQLGNTRNINTFTFQSGNVNPTSIVVTFHGTSGNDTMTGITGGGSPDDIMYGYDGADTMTGSGGNDTLYGGNGNDTLTGGADSDTLYGGAGNDLMEGGAGTDLFVYESGIDTVDEFSANSSGDTLWVSGGRTINDLSFSSTGTNDTKITITASVDEITVNRLRSGTTSHHVELIKFDDGFTTSLPDYASWLNGTSGNDVVAGNSSDNTMVGFAGNDTMTGGSGNDDMHGGAGNDTLDGDDGTDLLYGGDGDDILYGEGGLDTLHGGAGADTYKFHTASAFSNVDVIRGFSVSDDDIIDLTDILSAAYDPLTDDIADFISFSESSGSTFVSVDRDGTGGTYSMAQIIKLENVTGLSSVATLETNGNLIAA